MCGIAGIISIGGFDPEQLVVMTHKVKYRGPDGYGFAYFCPAPKCRGQFILNEGRFPSERPTIGLGHRRLAILDLSAAGSQPMQTEDGSLSVVFNGEIYNYLELRQELKKLGFSFRTHTDTEVLLYAYYQWGKDCLQRFNGMWSFAIWDRRHQQLFCARDRFGVKPFYYCHRDELFLLASEIKQISSFPGIPRKPNGVAVRDYLERGILNHGEETFFQGIRELPGGHYLTVDLAADKLTVQIIKYWDLPVEPCDGISEQTARAEFIEKLQDAVRLRMRSDVPVGSCLSGGLDSSSIVSIATPIGNSDNFHTFSACFSNPELDERPYISEIIATTNVKPHLVFPTGEEFARSLERLLWHQDEPIAGSSVFVQHTVMEAARRERVPVLLDGQGGDETLCGYRKFYYFYLWHLLKSKKPSFVTEAVCHFCQGDKSPLHWSDATRYLPAFLWRQTSVLARMSGDGVGSSGIPIDIGPGPNLAERQKADLLRFSLPVLLRYEDRNSMAHSIETRLPFLDYRLAEFLVNCPESLKLRRGWSKWILRDAMKGVLPDKVRLRKRKLGFDAPEEQWMRTNLSKMAEETFAMSHLKISPYLDARKVSAEYKKFYQGQRGALPASSLFRPLILELWAKVHDVAA